MGYIPHVVEYILVAYCLPKSLYLLTPYPYIVPPPTPLPCLLVSCVQIIAPPGPGHMIILLRRCLKQFLMSGFSPGFCVCPEHHPTSACRAHNLLSGSEYNGQLCCIHWDQGPSVSLSAHWSQLLSRTSQRSLEGLPSPKYPLCTHSPREGTGSSRVLSEPGSGVWCPGTGSGPGCGRWALWRWENLIPPQLQHMHVFENLLGRQDLLIFSTSCD